MFISRRHLLTQASLGLAAAARASSTLADPVPLQPAEPSTVSDLFPHQDPDLVRETVGASHAKLDRVRELLALHPALAKAAWDWGFGDWETALGAASHTGQREIAQLLIEHGARPDVFTFAMLGQLEVVKALIAANPGIQRLHGPHGITLLRHAEAGGEPAVGVLDYLRELGDADIGENSTPLTPEEAARYEGDYQLDSPADRLVVVLNRQGKLTFRRGEDGAARNLLHEAGHTFHPVGAPAVSIRFDVTGGRSSAVEILDGPIQVRAQRI